MDVRKLKGFQLHGGGEGFALLTPWSGALPLDPDGGSAPDARYRLALRSLAMYLSQTQFLDPPLDSSRRTVMDNRCRYGVAWTSAMPNDILLKTWPHLISHRRLAALSAVSIDTLSLFCYDFRPRNSGVNLSSRRINLSWARVPACGEIWSEFAAVKMQLFSYRFSRSKSLTSAPCVSNSRQMDAWPFHAACKRALHPH